MSQQVRGDDADDPTTYLVSFNKTDARYLVFHLNKILHLLLTTSACRATNGLLLIFL